MEAYEIQGDNLSRPTAKAMILKTLLLALTVGTSVFIACAIVELIRDRDYLNREVIHSDIGVRRVDGFVKKARRFYLGKSDNNLRVKVSGLNKWIYLTGVGESEAEQLVIGSPIEIDVYRPRPNAWITRKFVRDHVVRALGYSIQGKVIRKTSAAKQTLAWTQFANFSMSVFCLLVTSAGAFVIYHCDFDKKKSIRQKQLLTKHEVARTP